MTKVTIGATAVFACILCATPLSVRFGPEGKVLLSADRASAEIGRPLTATSVAGVNRRAHRRAYRRGYDQYGAYNNPYQYGAYNNPYRYGYGMYQPANTGWFGNQTWGSSGYAYQPYNRYQQPYSGYDNGYRQWWEF